MKVYFVKYSTDKGKHYQFIYKNGYISCTENHCIAEETLNSEYQDMREFCKDMKIPHVAKKYFKIVEQEIGEEIW